MKSREISLSKIGPFSLACTDPYIGIEWEYQSTYSGIQVPENDNLDREFPPPPPPPPPTVQLLTERKSIYNNLL